MANMLALRPTSAALFGDVQVALRTTAAADASTTYEVQEVWSGGKPLPGSTPIKCSAVGCKPLTVEVAGSGGTTYVRLVPRG
jgi:hypothetical protein